MTVILVLFTFLVFIAVDLVLSRRKGIAGAVEETQPVPIESEQGWMEGFRVPGNLQYHPGHSWLLRERKNVVRVGADEFASALLGAVDNIDLPKPGHWVRQGQKSWAFFRNGEKTEMVSPIEGEVVSVNEEILKDPSLLRKDPYGAGWLLTLFVPDEEGTRRNLLPTNLVAGWMQSAVERLYGLQPQLAGAVAADGGRPVDDLFQVLGGHSWEQVTREFFLT